MRIDAPDAELYPQQATELVSGRILLPYLERGARGGIPVILLHGYTDSCRSFTPIIERLPPTIRAIALTQRGHGDASRPQKGYRPRDLAADLSAFLDAMGIERAVIAGHSMGAQVAMRFAVEHPRRVRGLVLLGAFATLRGNPIIAELRTTVEMLRDPIDPDFVREFQQGTLARAVSDRFFETVVAESLKVPSRIWRAALAGQIEEDVSPQLDRIVAPTLIAYGDRDAIVSRKHQELLAAAISGARVSIHAGGGHGFHWEDPTRFARELAAFVGTLG